MQETAYKKAFFIVNGNAGHGKAKDAWQQLLPLIEQYCPSFGWEFTPAANHGAAMARRALDEGYDLIVAVGGDGTMHEVLNGFLCDDKPYKPESMLAFWAMGSGCDTARTVYGSRDKEVFLEMLKQGKPAAFDAGKCRYKQDDDAWAESYFMNSCSAGIGADVAYYTNTHSKALGGTLSFLKAALVCLVKYKPPQMRVVVDGREYKGRYMLAAVGNGKYFGSGMKFVPEASFTDGKLDMLLADEVKMPTILMLLAKLYKGAHTTHPIVHISRFEKMSVEVEFQKVIELDGETVGYTDIEISVLPSVFNMLVPKDFIG